MPTVAVLVVADTTLSGIRAGTVIASELEPTQTRLSQLRTSARNLLASTSSARYGFVAQACSSATNLGLVILAARLLGPTGVGTISIGYWLYLTFLAFQRAFVVDPLVITSSAQSPKERLAAGQSAMSLALASALLLSLCFVVVGFLLPDPFGKGILLFAPFLAPALTQDLARSILFRDRRGWSNALSDAVWLVTMAAAALLVLANPSEWTVAGCWGAGAITGAMVGLHQVRWRPVSPRTATAWWRSEARSLAGWLGAQGALFAVASYLSVLALAGILGAADYGGLRAAYSIFAPLTLVGTAVALPGLPRLSTLVSQSHRQALRITTQFGILITAITAIYSLLLYAFPGLWTLLFGTAFASFHTIVLPIGVGQVLLAPTVALTLLLKAQRRGGALLALGAVYVSSRLVFSVVLALTFGLEGAAWAAAAASILLWFSFILVLRQNRTSATSASVATKTSRSHIPE